MSLVLSSPLCVSCHKIHIYTCSDTHVYIIYSGLSILDYVLYAQQPALHLSQCTYTYIYYIKSVGSVC